MLSKEVSRRELGLTEAVYADALGTDRVGDRDTGSARQQVPDGQPLGPAGGNAVTPGAHAQVAFLDGERTAAQLVGQVGREAVEQARVTLAKSQPERLQRSHLLGIHLGSRRAEIEVSVGTLRVTRRSALLGASTQIWRRSELSELRVEFSGLTVNNRRVNELRIYDSEGNKVAGCLGWLPDGDLKWICSELSRALWGSGG